MHGSGMSMQGVVVVLAFGGENLALDGRVWCRERIASRVSRVGTGQPSGRAGQTNAATPWSVDSLVLLVRGRHGVVEKAVTRATRLASATGRVPSHAGARLEEPGSAEGVATGFPWIAGEKQARRSVYILATLCARNERRRIKVLHPVEFFVLGEVRLPSHTELEGEPLREANVVVDVGADRVLPSIKRLHRSLHKVAWHPEQEISQGIAGELPVKGERAVRYHVVPVIEQH